jgi:plastocyanin
MDMRRSRRFERFVVAGVAAAASLAAIAAAAQGTSAAREGGLPTAGVPRQDPRSAAGVEVEIRNFSFHPSPLRVDRGARVTFVNRDGAAHDATRRGSFSTGLLRPGEAATLRFRRRGTFKYVCTLHPGMRGKVVVR